MTTIATGGEVVSSVTTRTYDGAGTAGWTADHTTTVLGTCFDSSGNVYTGGSRSSGNLTTRKYDGTGTLQWSKDHGTTVRALAAHPGGVVTGGSFGGSYTCRLYVTSDGTLTWSRNYLGGTVYGIAADADGNVYVGGNVTSSKTTIKYNSAGTEVWSANNGAAVRGIAVDADGNVYTGGVGLNETTRKYNSSGTEQWAVQHDISGPSTVYCIAVDAEGNVYTGGLVVGGSSPGTTRKYDTDGNLLWSANHGATVWGIAVDAEGNVYTSGASSSSLTTRKYNSSGTLQWSANHGGIAYCIAALSPASLPGLPIPLGLGVPFAAFAALPPSLPVGLALGIPSTTPIPTPPDLTAYAVPPTAFYRLYLSGSSTLLELPLASFQCRRRLGDSTWLDVDCGFYSAALYAGIAARLGGEIVIYAGVRAADGSETSGQFLRAVLTEYRYEVQPFSGSIRLVGRVVPTTFSATSRTLIGVSQRGKDTAGRKTARAGVDFLLRPNDTVNDGATTWTAGAILYFVGPNDSWMTVTEAD